MHVDIMIIIYVHIIDIFNIEYPISNILNFNMNINISYHLYAYLRVFFHFNLNLIPYGPSVIVTMFRGMTRLLSLVVVVR